MNKKNINLVKNLNLREVSLSNKKFNLLCKHCKNKLEYNTQFNYRLCSQICYNQYNYNEYFEKLNQIS